MKKVRLLPDFNADGATQMAADQAMLESAAAGSASLRFYTWSEPTLSLGYFQKHADRLAGLPYVRRATGGGAIVHDRELTYSFALPAGGDWQPKGEPWSCRMHYLLIDVFAALGVSAGVCGCGEEKWLGPFLCFEHQTPGDVLIAGSKVVGSAQRRRRGATLQHGSVLLARSPHAPTLPGVAELSGTAVGCGQVRDGVLARLPWDIEPGDWTAAERDLTEQTRREQYARPWWNDKR